MNFISEYVDKEFAFIAVYYEDIGQKIYKINNESEVLDDFVEEMNKHSNQEWMTINGCPMVKCLITFYDKLKPLLKRDGELHACHQFKFQPKNNDGRFFEKQFNLIDLLGKDITFAKIMSLQNNKVIKYDTEINYLRDIYPFYKKDIELRFLLEKEYGICPYKTRYEIIHDIFKNKTEKGEEEREKDWDIKDIIFKYDTENKEVQNVIKSISQLSVKNNDISDLINEKVVIKGLELNMKMGGLHGSKQGNFESNEEDVILYYDVTSFYPSIIVNNKLVPNNIKGFSEVYNDFYQKKIEGNREYKDLINFVYGYSNHKTSMFYDPKFTTTITINGEIMMIDLLCNLSKVSTLIPLLVNTDGFYCIVARDEVSKADEIINLWKDKNKFNVTKEEVDKISIKNGNNYFKIGDINKYSHKIKIEEKEIASYDGSGIYNPINLTNNPLKSLDAKEECKEELFKWLING